MAQRTHSGLILRLFAQTYPAESAGLMLVDAFGTDIKPLFREQWPSYKAILNQPGTALDTKPGFETVDADEAIAAVEPAPALPKIPLAVDLEPQTPHILATGSDHYVQIRDPALVISVVKLIFDRARASAR